MSHEEGTSAWIVSKSTAAALIAGEALGPFKLGPVQTGSDVWSYVDAPGSAFWHQGLLCRVRPVSGTLAMDLMTRRAGSWRLVASRDLAAGARLDPATWGPMAIQQLQAFGTQGPFSPWLSVIRSRRLRPVLAGSRPVALLEIAHCWPLPGGSGDRDWTATIAHSEAGELPLGRALRVARLYGLDEALLFDRQRLTSLLADLALAPADPEVPPSALFLLAATGSAPRSRTWRQLARIDRLASQDPALSAGRWAEKLVAAAHLDPAALPPLRHAAALWIRHREAAVGPPPHDVLVAALTASLATPSVPERWLELAGPHAAIWALALKGALSLASMHPARPPGAEARAWVSLLLGRPWNGGWLSGDRAPSGSLDSERPAAPPARDRAARSVSELCRQGLATLEGLTEDRDEPGELATTRQVLGQLRAVAAAAAPEGELARTLDAMVGLLEALQTAEDALDLALERAAGFELPERVLLVPLVDRLLALRSDARKRAGPALAGRLRRKAVQGIERLATEPGNQEPGRSRWPSAGPADRRLRRKRQLDGLIGAGSGLSGQLPEPVRQILELARSEREELERAATPKRKERPATG